MYIQRELFPESPGPKGTGTVSSASTNKQAGVVYTGAEAVNFMLDLIGYRENEPLFERSILEPSFGGGSFLLEIIRRLLQSCRKSGFVNYPALESCIRAVELDEATYADTRLKVSRLLAQSGVPAAIGGRLVEKWLVQGDFLLWAHSGSFDFVIGNPPYVRQEQIAADCCKLYRERFRTWSDRADIYVPFYEKGLQHLADGGKLLFICSNRWMKNRYGKRLRQFVTKNYSIDYVIDVSSPDLFDRKVTAYPSITLISRKIQRDSKVQYGSYAGPSKGIRSVLDSCYEVEWDTRRMPADAVWIWESTKDAAFYSEIQTCFPVLEDTGCKVGIGVATGADKIFIDHVDRLPVERDRILPLAMSGDIQQNILSWGGMGVINPFDPKGTLIRLEDYPALSAYLHQHRKELENRHCARKNPATWYRTIDKIYEHLAMLPKILVPDIKGELTPVIDHGGLYPHHNLYYILPGPWNIHALRAILMSDFCQNQIKRCCTIMNGGALRCQAQYLRKLHIPRFDDIPPDFRTMLSAAGASGNKDECSQLVRTFTQSIMKRRP